MKQIVITLTDGEYHYMMKDYYSSDFYKEKIINGIAIPEDHGKIIDVNDLHGEKMTVSLGNGNYDDITVYYENDIDAAIPIL